MEEQEKVLMGQKELKRWHLMKMVEVEEELGRVESWRSS